MNSYILKQKIMACKRKKLVKKILTILIDIAENIKFNGIKTFNERYLHHFFTHELQKKDKLLDLKNDRNKILLHPEWPTFKKETEIKCGRYKYNKKEKKYYPDNENGSAGFIDFAIGDYQSPSMAIEFSLKYGWQHEEIVFDLIKLLDRKNPFKVAISFNVILREKQLVQSKDEENLEKKIKEAYENAYHRLKKQKRLKTRRELYYIITEIDSENKRRHWYWENNQLKKRLPKYHFEND